MSGHLTSIDGYLMWQQANALVFHHTLLFVPPINWETHVFSTSYFAIGLSIAYAPGLFLWSLLQPDAAARVAPRVGGAGMYEDALYQMFGAPIHIVVSVASAYLVARIIRQLGFSQRTAVLGLVLYALSSLAFVYARGDYAQPLETFCWLAAFSAAISLRTRRSWLAMLCCAAAVCMAILTRTLEGVLLVPALILVLVADFRSLRRAVLTPQSAAILAGSLVGLGVTALVDELRYANVLETGYGTAGGPASWSELWSTPLLVGLAGSLISPARGIIWATPAILLAPFGLRRLWRSPHRMIGLGFAVASLLLLVMTAKWFAWWGGLDWGLRLYLPAMPLLLILAAIATATGRVPRWIVGIVFLVGLVCAVPGVTTDALAGYGGLSDATEGSFRWQAYPPLGAWQYVKYAFPVAPVDVSSIDLFWFKLAPVTHNRSLMLMAGLLAAAMACAVRVYALLWPGELRRYALASSQWIPVLELRQQGRVVASEFSDELSELRAFARATYRSGAFRTIVALVVIAATLRLYRLDYFSFWLDETVQYGWANATFGDMLFKLQPDQLFLNSFISHLLIRAHLGDTIWQLRLPSAIAGTATVVAMWALGRTLFGTTVGLVAGLLTGFWPALVLYSQEYRPYAIEVLLATLTLLFLVRGLQTNRPIWWALLAMTAVPYMYNHMTSVIAVGALAVAAALWFAMVILGVPGLIAFERRAVLGRAGYLLMAAGLIGVGYLPGVMILARFLALSDTDPVIAGVKSPLVLNPTNLATIFGKYLGLGGGAMLYLTVGLALVGLVWSLRHRPYAALLAVTVIAVPLLAFAHTGGGGSLLNSQRYSLFLSPMYVLMIAVGVVVVTRWLMRASAAVDLRLEYPAAILPSLALAIPIAPLLFGMYTVNPKEIPMDIRGAYTLVLANVHPGDVILQTSINSGTPAQWFDYYDDYFMRGSLRPQDVLIARFGQDWGRPEPVCLTLKDNRSPSEHRKECVTAPDRDRAARVAQLPSQIPPLAAAPGKVWLMIAAPTPDQDALRAMFGSNADVTCFTGMCIVSNSRGPATSPVSVLQRDLPELAPRAI